ncbi:MAG: hypothetical protein WCS22_01280 [Acholeplasmataceae bacterium]
MKFAEWQLAGETFDSMTYVIEEALTLTAVYEEKLLLQEIDTFFISGRGVVVVMKVLLGTLHVDDMLYNHKEDIEVTPIGLIVNNLTVTQANKGETVDALFSGVTKEQMENFRFMYIKNEFDLSNNFAATINVPEDAPARLTIGGAAQVYLYGADFSVTILSIKDAEGNDVTETEAGNTYTIEVSLAETNPVILLYTGQEIYVRSGQNRYIIRIISKGVEKYEKEISNNYYIFTGVRSYLYSNKL